MKKWILLSVLTALLLAITFIPALEGFLHSSYLTMVVFFSIQAFVLFRIDSLIPEQWKVHASLVKIIIRFLSSATLILVLMYQYEDRFTMVVQFIVIYLIYMIFEIGMALTNLRRN